MNIKKEHIEKLKKDLHESDMQGLDESYYIYRPCCDVLDDVFSEKYKDYDDKQALDLIENSVAKHTFIHAGRTHCFLPKAPIPNFLKNFPKIT